jgi:hypothetical protein
LRQTLYFGTYDGRAGVWAGIALTGYDSPDTLSFEQIRRDSDGDLVIGHEFSLDVDDAEHLANEILRLAAEARASRP